MPNMTERIKIGLHRNDRWPEQEEGGLVPWSIPEASPKRVGAPIKGRISYSKGHWELLENLKDMVDPVNKK